MQQSFVSPQSENAWLFHRSKWSTIDNPLVGLETPIFRASGSRHRKLRRVFSGYELTSWTLGPTFLQPYYSGYLVYVFLNEEARKAHYLLLVETPQSNEIVYAQDLPDMFDLLQWLAPIVQTSILVDLYQRGINTFSRS